MFSGCLTIDCLRSFCLVQSKLSNSQVVHGCTGQAALERQDLPCTYLAHHERESFGKQSKMLMQNSRLDNSQDEV